MWEFICEYISTISKTRSINDILNIIQQNNICTNTQCFQDNESAGFGSDTVATIPTTYNNFMYFTIFMLLYATLLHPKSLFDGKPRVRLLKSD